MNKSKFAALLFSLAGIAAGPALADNTGLYFGGSVGNSSSKDTACVIPDVACNRKDTAYSGNLGVMFTPNWGVEAAYHDLGRVFEQDDMNGTSAFAKTKAVSLVLVGAFPIQSFSLYGKFGGYRAKTDLTSTAPGVPEGSSKNNQWTYSAGIRWDVFKHLALRAEWSRLQNVGGGAVGFRSDIDTYSGGVLLTF